MIVYTDRMKEIIKEKESKVLLKRDNLKQDIKDRLKELIELTFSDNVINDKLIEVYWLITEKL